MAYNPQRGRPRHRPDPHEPSIVDSLLDAGADPAPRVSPEPAPPPGPARGHEPADTWSEKLLCSVGVSSVLGAAAALLVLRWFWKIRRRRHR